MHLCMGNDGIQELALVSNEFSARVTNTKHSYYFTFVNLGGELYGVWE